MRGLVLLIVAGCTERVDLGAPDGIPGLVALAVSPPDETIAFDRISPPAHHVAYVATGSFEDGHTEDVTTRVTWLPSTPYPGRFDAPGDYTATGDAVGHVGIRAISGPIEGDAALTITMTATMIDDVFGLPPNPNVFDGATAGSDPMRQPAVRYPAHEARFPQELEPMLFQHALGTGNDTVRLHFTSDVLDLSVITASDRLSSPIVQKLVAGSHPGGSVTYSLDGAASATPGTYFSAPPVTLQFSAGPITDAIYFFSSQAGVVRGGTADASATAIVATGGDPHLAVSGDGRVMVFEEADKLSTFDLDALAPLLPPRENMGFATFSPDGTRMLVADRGTLTLRSTATGKPVGPPMGKVPLGGTMKGTHPDWSPDGRYIALAVSDMIDNLDAKHASIARLPVDGDTFGPLEILVPSGGDMDNNFAPRWGPDGALAYVHATSAAKDAKNAELRLLLDADATPSAPIRLVLASLRTGTVDVVDTAVVMPSWTIANDGTAWLAFTSTRPYGVIRPAKGTSQVWVAGIDLARPDPSFAAFWLPCQSITATDSGVDWAPLPSAQTD